MDLSSEAFYRGGAFAARGKRVRLAENRDSSLADRRLRP